MSNHKERRAPKPRIIAPAMFLIGELIPWKGYYWRISLGSSLGGEVRISTETGEQKAVSEQPLLVLERRGETNGQTKRIERTARWNKQHCQSK